MIANDSQLEGKSDAIYNLSGQKLGRKGQQTRLRIIAAMQELIARDEIEPVTLSAVARSAGLGMSTLYLYFPDLGDLLLAALEGAMDESDQAFEQHLRQRWADDELLFCAGRFVRAYFTFWRKHAPLLRMRNRFADARDPRLARYRFETTAPLIDLLAKQMDMPPEHEDAYRDCAAVLLTGLERITTIVMTAQMFEEGDPADPETRMRTAERMTNAQANILSVVIGDMRRNAQDA